MATQDLFVETFKSAITGGGARGSLFKVIMNIGEWGGDNQTASFLCKSASLPASSVEPITVPFRGREIKLAGDKKFEPWEITIINDTNFNVRNAFERWLNTINSHEGNIGNQTPSNYKREMEIYQLDKNGNELKQYRMVGCFPSTIGAIEMSYDNAEIEEFPVTIEYDYWTSIDTTT